MKNITSYHHFVYRPTYNEFISSLRAKPLLMLKKFNIVTQFNNIDYILMAYCSKQITKKMTISLDICVRIDFSFWITLAEVCVKFSEEQGFPWDSITSRLQLHWQHLGSSTALKVQLSLNKQELNVPIWRQNLTFVLSAIWLLCQTNTRAEAIWINTYKHIAYTKQIQYKHIAYL